MAKGSESIYSALLESAKNIKSRIACSAKLKITRISKNSCLIEEKTWLQSPSFILIITILPDNCGTWHIYCTAANNSLLSLAKEELIKLSLAYNAKIETGLY